MKPRAPRTLVAVLSVLFLSFPALAGDVESLLIRLMSGEASTDTVWLTYELEAKEGDIRYMTHNLGVIKRHGLPASEVRAAELAIERANFRKDIIAAKLAGNPAKVEILVALTNLMEKGQAVDMKALAPSAKVFMRSRVAEADARLGVAKAEQAHKEMKYRESEVLIERYAITKEQYAQAAEQLKVANTMLAQAQEQVKTARQLYEEIVKEKP